MYEVAQCPSKDVYQVINIDRKENSFLVLLTTLHEIRMKPMEVQPICLPEPDITNTDNELAVTVGVGWGQKSI